MSAALRKQLLATAIIAALVLAVTKLPPGFETIGPVVVVVAALAVILWIGGGSSLDSDAVADAVRRVASGERPLAAPRSASPETVRVLAELEEMYRSRRKTEKEAEARSKELREARQTFQEAALELQASVERELGVASDTTRIVKSVSGEVADLASSLASLAANADASSTSILRMTTANDEVAQNVAELSGSVRETVSSIEEMAFSIKEVARNIDALSLTAEETSSSMNAMDLSIDQVQSNANETARLSEEVSMDADTGALAILKTLSEINRIKESSLEAVAVIATLGSRIEAIGQIVNVIDDVAEQTNLLALNAAIIAAQAGEQGKGFAVVADEIKDLAERAATSTREITDLIKTVQAESKNAVHAVERGALNVDRGVEVSNEAERALKKILESSRKSTNMVRAIARATVEQATGSKHVTDSIGRIAETVQQIAAATAQQARGTEHVLKSAEKMRVIAQHVEKSSQEQARGGRQVTGAIGGIATMVQQLSEGQKSQSRGAGELVEASAQIESMARAQSEQVKKLGQVLDTLRRLGM